MGVCIIVFHESQFRSVHAETQSHEFQTKTRSAVSHKVSVLGLLNAGVVWMQGINVVNVMHYKNKNIVKI